MRDSLKSVNPTASTFIDRLRTADPAALNQLTDVLYQDLHRIAARQLRAERLGHTLQATALVHEAYVKLSDYGGRNFVDQAHFLAVASRVMRQLLVDYARSRATQKRSAGGEAVHKTLVELPGEKGVELIDLIELDGAMQGLAEEDEKLARLVEMRYFGGMTAEESAEALGLSVHVVRHDLRFAQAWLRRRLEGPQAV
jgi:RNA polymerase sigma factor (TIGR02999 family)